jgi:hypothetical protein
MSFDELVNKLSDAVKGHEIRGEPCISINPYWSECSRREELEGEVHVFSLDSPQLQKEIETAIINYCRSEDSHFVVTTPRFCPGDPECHGHYVDPFNGPDEHIHIGEFPENLPGSHIHIMDGSGYLTFRISQRFE